MPRSFTPGQIRDQLSFGGFDPPPPSSPPPPPRVPKGSTNIFFAALPNIIAADHSVETCERLRGQYGLRGPSVGRDRFHVSLLGFGAVDAIPKVVAFANRIASLISIPAFDVAFDRAMSLSGRSLVERSHPIVVHGEGARGFENLLRAQLDAVITLGFPTKRRKFTPHMTLLYDKKRLPEQTIAPIAWTVRDYSLIQSHVGQSRYTELGRWPLRD